MRRLALLSLLLAAPACAAHGPGSAGCEQLAAQLRGYEETFTTEITRSQHEDRVGLERAYHVFIEGQGCKLTARLDKLGEDGRTWAEDRQQSGRGRLRIDPAQHLATSELTIARRDGSGRLDVTLTVVPDPSGDAVVDVDTTWRPWMIAALTGYESRDR